MTGYTGWCPEHGPLIDDDRDHEGDCRHCQNGCTGPGSDAALEALRERDLLMLAPGNRLDGYRELGAKCAKLEEERDEAYAKLRIATQTLRDIESWDTPSLMARVALGRMGVAKP